MELSVLVKSPRSLPANNSVPLGSPAKARGNSYKEGCSQTPDTSPVLGTLLR